MKKTIKTILGLTTACIFAQFLSAQDAQAAWLCKFHMKVNGKTYAVAGTSHENTMYNLMQACLQGEKARPGDCVGPHLRAWWYYAAAGRANCVEL